MRRIFFYSSLLKDAISSTKEKRDALKQAQEKEQLENALDGKVSIAYSSFPGCQKGEDGQMEIETKIQERGMLRNSVFGAGSGFFCFGGYGDRSGKV